ncbi:MAG: fibronectin type III-like domain-contianing protein, partial [Ruminococcus sp.]|nr:fibronectin type III-like domain-contianing protein [Ruminococcus sp.]
YLSFPGEGDRVRYTEGVFVGYRYYDKKNMEVRYPFGYGLSYTTFEYSDIKVSAYELSDKKSFTVECTITNTGDRDGAEVVQLYIEPLTPTVIRPIKELKGFEKVFLKAGESRRVIFRLDKSAFAYYSDIIHDWISESGEYNILIGESSLSICLEEQVHFNSSVKIPVRFTLDNPGGDIRQIKEGFELFKDTMKDVAATANGGADQLGESAALMALAMADDLPLHAMVSFTDNPDITRERLQMMIDQLNARMIELDMQEAQRHSET